MLYQPANAMAVCEWDVNDCVLSSSCSRCKSSWARSQVTKVARKRRRNNTTRRPCQLSAHCQYSTDRQRRQAPLDSRSHTRRRRPWADLSWLHRPTRHWVRRQVQHHHRCTVEEQEQGRLGQRGRVEVKAVGRPSHLDDRRRQRCHHYHLTVTRRIAPSQWRMMRNDSWASTSTNYQVTHAHYT